jgi:hypothetical protein
LHHDLLLCHCSLPLGRAGLLSLPRFISRRVDWFAGRHRLYSLARLDDLDRYAVRVYCARTGRLL